MRVTVDIGLMSSSGRDCSQWIGHIGEGIAPGEVFAQLFDHAKTVIAGAWGKMRKAFQITIHDLSGNARFEQVLFEQKAVEVRQQLRLRLIIGA